MKSATENEPLWRCLDFASPMSFFVEVKCLLDNAHSITSFGKLPPPAPRYWTMGTELGWGCGDDWDVGAAAGTWKRVAMLSPKRD